MQQRYENWSYWQRFAFLFVVTVVSAFVARSLGLTDVLIAGVLAVLVTLLAIKWAVARGGAGRSGG